MKKEDFWKAYDKAFEAIKWAIEEYFGEEAISEHKVMRDAEDISKCLKFMNDAWFLLPDHTFNIITNPPGWHTFLSFLENEAMENIE